LTFTNRLLVTVVASVSYRIVLVQGGATAPSQRRAGRSGAVNRRGQGECEDEVRRGLRQATTDSSACSRHLLPVGAYTWMTHRIPRDQVSGVVVRITDDPHDPVMKPACERSHRSAVAGGKAEHYRCTTGESSAPPTITTLPLRPATSNNCLRSAGASSD